MDSSGASKGSVPTNKHWLRFSLAHSTVTSSSFQYTYLPNSNLIANVTGPAHTVTNLWEPNRDVLDLKENKAGNTLEWGQSTRDNMLDSLRTPP